MSETKQRGPVGATFHHMRVNPILWAAGFAVIGAACLYIRASQGVSSHWGDAMAFAFMASGIMIVAGGDRDHRAELPYSQTQETSNV